ncbi:MAG: helix-turn-helix domain-containing protein [Labedaea sp.]
MRRVQSPDEARSTLARRLKALREAHWTNHKLTQLQLAKALGVSGPLISSWETNAQLPSEDRLEDYATFFASSRSASGGQYRLIEPAKLSDDELTRRENLLAELVELRAVAMGDAGPPSFWQFPARHDVTIIGSELPAYVRELLPDPNPNSPDFVELYKYADLDALFELHGHIRALNPANVVNLRAPSELTPDDYTTHIVLVGGIDWNALTAELQYRLDFPVQQRPREKASDTGGFEVVAGGKRQLFEPRLRGSSDQKVLVEDVAHFYRGHNPFREQRTVTICNGMFGRGTLGVVRALTDVRFREGNEGYLRTRFGHNVDTLSLVTRVSMIRDAVVTPDWTVARNRLHEWPETRA